MKTLLLTILLAMFAVAAESQVRFSVSEESRLWIAGSSNVNSFICETNEAAGFGLLPDEELIAPAALTDVPITRPQVEVIVPVQKLDCGRDRMNQDMYNALKADSYPAIRYTLSEATVTGAVEGQPGWQHVQAKGTLTIAGVTRNVTVALKGRILPDGRLQARGSAPLLMTDFDIEPPSAMFGIVKARDRIEVHFDLVAEPQETRVSTRQ